MLVPADCVASTKVVSLAFFSCSASARNWSSSFMMTLDLRGRRYRGPVKGPLSTEGQHSNWLWARERGDKGLVPFLQQATVVFKAFRESCLKDAISTGQLSS